MQQKAQGQAPLNGNSGKAGIALEYLMQGFVCSSAVFMPYACGMGLAPQAAANIASGFAGGMARGKTCGAVTGAIMVIGMKCGPTNPRDLYRRDMCAQMVQEFSHRFEKCRTSLECAEILALNNVDAGNPEEMKNLRGKGLCEKVVHDAALILDELLAEEM